MNGRFLYAAGPINCESGEILERFIIFHSREGVSLVN